MVSMPYTGGTTFLHKWYTATKDLHMILCQCPTRAGLHFYTQGYRANQFKKNRVNALHGRDYISTCLDANYQYSVRRLCQCPTRAGLHFYGEKSIVLKKPHEWCQCPTRAGLHFYPTSLRPSVYAGFKPLFFAHFSEYSDILAKQGVKVGKGRIVFFREQFSMFFIV